jgi:hypothetical protein
MTEEMKSAVKAWKALSREQQIEFVLRIRKGLPRHSCLCGNARASRNAACGLVAAAV